MKATFFPGWSQVGVAMMVQAISSASVFLSYSIIAAHFKTEFEPSNMVLMLGVAVAIVSGGLMSPFIGAAIDKLSIRMLMLIGSVFLSAGFFLLSLTTSMLQVLAVYAIVISVGNLLLGQLSASTLVARWFTRRRGFAMGIAVSGVAVGGILIPPFLQMLMDNFEWRNALQVFSVFLFLISAPVIALLVVDRPADRNLFPDGDSKPAEVDEVIPAITTKEVIRSGNFWMLVVIIGVIFFGPVALISNMIPFVANSGIDGSRGALLLSIYSIASFCGKLSYAGFADRVNQRIALMGILLVLAAGVGGFLLSSSYSMLVIASILTGLSSGAALPLRSVIMAHVYGPDNLGRVLGLIGLFTMPFSIVSPPLFGLIFDHTHSYNSAFIGYLLMLAVAIILLTRLNLSKHKPADSTSPG